MVVSDEYLYLRTGIIWRGQIPLDKIAELRKPAPTDAKAPGYANLSLIGSPNMVVVLEDAHEIEGLFARKREVDLIGISLDDSGAFLEDISSRLRTLPCIFSGATHGLE